MARILIIEDEVVLGRNLRAFLRQEGHEVELEASAETGLERILAGEPDVIILDLKLPGMDGMTLLKALRAHHVSSSIIIMTSHGDVETAVEAMKQGAKDFLTKSGRLSELGIVVARVLQQRALEEKLDYYTRREEADSHLEKLVGDSAGLGRIKSAVRRLTESAALASQEPPTVLITGETGVGKDMVARAIHFDGPRRSHPFVQVNCVAIPDSLFESELFGHARGAFTGARTSKRGLFTVADGGTLFLDEVGHMTLPMQAKLLTVLERRVIRPVGATSEQALNVHIIAATNRDLELAVARQEFRQDLYHRLRVFPLVVPPLRERVEDLDALISHFIARGVRRLGRRPVTVSAAAVERLKAHAWPGNVRELSHLIENLLLVSPSDEILPEHLPLAAAVPEGGVEIRLGNRDLIDVDFARQTLSLEDVEERIIEAALAYTRHNVSRAARVLGVTRDFLRSRVRRIEQRGQPAAE